MTAARRRTATAVGWLALAALAVLPLTALAVQALATRWFFPDLIPDEWTLREARRVAWDPRTRDAAAASLAVGVVATVASMALAIPAARALTIGRLRRARLAALGFLLPTALPPIAIAMGLNVALLRAGVAGSHAAVAMAHLVATLPYAVLILTAALTRYDAGYERQAAALGAGTWRILIRVFAPLAAPGILVTAAVVFTVSWSQYLLTLLPGGGSVVTLPMLVLSASGGGNPTAAAAIAMVAAVPPALATLLVVRRLDALGGSAGGGP